MYQAEIQHGTNEANPVSPPISNCRALVVITGSRALVGPIEVKAASARPTTASARGASVDASPFIMAAAFTSTDSLRPAEPEAPRRNGTRPDWFKPVEAGAPPRASAQKPARARSAAERRTPARPGSRFWPLASAASVALALACGYQVGVMSSGKPADMAELSDLRARLAALESARPRDDVARAAVASLRSEMTLARDAGLNRTMALAAQVESLNQAVRDRLDRIEQTVFSHDQTASIRVAPNSGPALKAAENVTVVGRSPANAKQFAAMPDWTLLSVVEGVANVQGPAGVRQVMPGDAVPGLGRVRSIELREGRMVVITSQGVIDQALSRSGYAFAPPD